jgi:hypothetical protein
MASKNNTSMFVPVKDIREGMIVLDNSYKVAGIKIMPKNIFILDSATEQNMINNLKNVYNQIDYEFWLIVADRPVDINVYLSELQALYNNAGSLARRKLIVQDIEKANQFTNNNVVDTEYYLLFKEKDAEKAKKKVRDLIGAFASSNMTAYATTNEDMRIVLENFLNGGMETRFGTVIANGY